MSDPGAAAPDGSQSPPSSRTALALALALVAVVLASLLTLPALGDQALWTDEANTALLGRSLLQHGRLLAWDGKNLIGFGNGSELDENLEVVYLPPQQYYLAAAGMRLLGDNAPGARFFFVLLGLASIAVTAWWSRRFFGESFPWFLPALLLALTPAFLLFIRNARYYSPGIFWSALLLGAWTAAAAVPPPAAPGTPPASPPLRFRRGIWIYHLFAALAVAGLFTSQFLYAAATLAALPAFFLDRRFRTRRQFCLLGTLALCGAAGALWLFSLKNPGGMLMDRRGDPLAWVLGSLELFWWHLRDMGYYEFFAWPMLLPFFLPWLVPRFRAHRQLAVQSLVLLASVLLFIAAISFLSPQNVARTLEPDMRYLLPILVMGALLSAASLTLLWRANRWFGAVTALALLGTNVLYLGAHRQQRRDLVRPGVIRSTLYDYVQEIFRPYPTTFRALIDTLSNLPAGTTVWLNPTSLTYTPMFYLPELRYCDQFASKRPLSEKYRGQLPDYLFPEKASPEVVITLNAREVPWILVDEFERGDYKYGGLIKTHAFDEARPEIPLRMFYPPPEKLRKGGLHLWIRKDLTNLVNGESSGTAE